MGVRKQTIVLYFEDRSTRYEGTLFECGLQVQNARLFPGFKGWTFA